MKCVIVAVLLMSAPAFAQEPDPDHQLAACQAQVTKLAGDLVQARLEALRKTEEAKAYEAAVKVQNALKAQDAKK